MRKMFYCKKLINNFEDLKIFQMSGLFLQGPVVDTVNPPAFKVEIDDQGRCILIKQSQIGATNQQQPRPLQVVGVS